MTGDGFDAFADPTEDGPADLGGLAQVQADVEGLRALFAEQVEAIEAIDDVLGRLVDLRDGTLKPAPWCYHEPPPHEGVDVLPTWVAWWNLRYAPNDAQLRIPDCWAEHGGLAAEVATLEATWRKAFNDARAAPDAAQNWHDRWLPGFLARMKMWLSSDCLSGEHRDPRPRREGSG